MHLLIVDDEPRYRFLASSALKKAGYKVSEAKDGQEAFGQILNAQEYGDNFNLILTESTVSGRSAARLVKELRSNDISIPVCIVTARYSNKLILNLLWMGCVGFLSKPFELHKLVEFVDGILKTPP